MTNILRMRITENYIYNKIIKKYIESKNKINLEVCKI